MDELPVSNLAPSQHLALWCSRGDQPRMNSAGENVQGGWEPGSQGQNTPSLPRRRAPQLSQPQNPSSALSPPLLSWQGVFCCYPAPPFLIPGPVFASGIQKTTINIRIEYRLKEQYSAFLFAFAFLAHSDKATQCTRMQRISGLRSSRGCLVVMNPASIHEDMGSIPGLT